MSILNKGLVVVRVFKGWLELLSLLFASKLLDDSCAQLTEFVTVLGRCCFQRKF
jgi:hypothetical protein